MVVKMVVKMVANILKLTLPSSGKLQEPKFLCYHGIRTKAKNSFILGETYFIPCLGWDKNKNYFLIICSLSKMGKLKYLSRGQNKNKNLFWNKILF
jgi:hypothetical protein